MNATVPRPAAVAAVEHLSHWLAKQCPADRVPMTPAVREATREQRLADGRRTHERWVEAARQEVLVRLRDPADPLVTAEWMARRICPYVAGPCRPSSCVAWQGRPEITMATKTGPRIVHPGHCVRLAADRAAGDCR